MRFLLFSLSALAIVQAQPPRDSPTQKSGTAVIRGRVVSADTGDPIRKAGVGITSDITSLDPVVTDANGQFEVRAVPAGRYVIGASKTGFAAVKLGARSDLDRPSPVEVADGAVVDDIVIQLPRAGAISGRVVDDLGEPVAGVGVRVGYLVRSDGRTRLVSARGRSFETDDLGEYRVGGLPAGRYIVSVLTNTIDNTAPAGRTWGINFYPAAANPSAAQTVPVTVGADVTGIDFALTLIRQPKLSISVVDASGNPVNGTLLLTADTPASVGYTRAVPTLQQGKTSQTLEPGDWLIIARASDGGIGVARVSLAPNDEASISIVAGRGAKLSGRVVFDGAAPPSLSNLDVNVRPFGTDVAFPVRGLANTPPSKLKADGTFEIAELNGPAEVYLPGLPRGWMLKSVTQEARELRDGRFDFKAGEDVSGVQLVFTDRVSELSGVAVTADGQPAPGCSMIVFPEDRALLQNATRWARWERADRTGRYRAIGLPGGVYFAVAVADVDPTAWSAPEYLEPFRVKAVRLTLKDGEKQNVSLECLRATP